MSSINDVQRDGYTISTDISQLNIDWIHHYLSETSYWAENIPRETVIKAISNSLCFGIYFKGEQIGFGRVVTDKATFAYLADIFITESFRGKGLSKWLLEVIHAHPELQGLRRWMLVTRDAHTLYEKFGWTVPDEESGKRIMQKHNKNIYQRSG